MKYFIYSILFSFLIACSSNDDSPSQSGSNIPSLVYPTNNLLCTSNLLNLEWTATSTNEAVLYQLEVSKENNFSSFVYTITTKETSQNLSFDIATTYYWRVRSVLNNESKGYSNTFEFYTEGVGVENHLPYSPELVSPLLNATIPLGTTNLSWNASDVDAGDVLTYDVYFGTETNPITKIETNLTSKTTNISVTSGNTYYWKVVVKDNNGGETLGNVWSFSVE